MNILGVWLDNFSKKEILEKINFFLIDPNFHQIVTINPEFILEAQKDLEFKNILNSSELKIADGIGVKLAFWRFGKKLQCRIAGADLLKKILKLAEKKELEIFLAINKNGLSNFIQIKKVLRKKYPNLKIKGVDLDKNLNIGKNLNIQSPILFCNFGAPWQEKFIFSQKNAMIRLAMGVGGSFDFLTDRVKRAPRWMRQIGLEWLWRLVQQPNRAKRIFQAIVVFPLKIIFNKK